MSESQPESQPESTEPQGDQGALNAEPDYETMFKDSYFSAAASEDGEGGVVVVDTPYTFQPDTGVASSLPVTPSVPSSREPSEAVPPEFPETGTPAPASTAVTASVGVRYVGGLTAAVAVQVGVKALADAAYVQQAQMGVATDILMLPTADVYRLLGAEPPVVEPVEDSPDGSA